MGLMGHLTLGWNQNLHTESDFLRCADLAVNLKMVVPKFCSDVVLPTLKDWVGNCIHKRAVSMCTGRIVDYAAETMFPTMANEILHRGIWLCGHGTDVDKHRASKPEHKWRNNTWHDKKGKHAVWSRFTSVYLSCLSFFVQRKTVFLVVQVLASAPKGWEFPVTKLLTVPWKDGPSRDVYFGCWLGCASVHVACNDIWIITVCYVCSILKRVFLNWIKYMFLCFDTKVLAVHTVLRTMGEIQNVPTKTDKSVPWNVASKQ